VEDCSGRPVRLSKHKSQIIITSNELHGELSWLSLQLFTAQHALPIVQSYLCLGTTAGATAWNLVRAYRLFLTSASLLQQCSYCSPAKACSVRVHYGLRGCRPPTLLRFSPIDVECSCLCTARLPDTTHVRNPRYSSNYYWLLSCPGSMKPTELATQ
jgi:hypothetical protein